eukprot:tig00021742_g23318.t1
MLSPPPVAPPPVPDFGFGRIAFSPCGQEIVAVTLDMRLQRFNCRTGSLLSEAHRIHSAGCDALAISPDRRLIATGGSDRMVRLWPYALSRTPAAPCPRQAFVGHPGTVSRVAFSRDGSRLVTAGAGSGLLLYEVERLPPRHHHHNLSFRGERGAERPQAPSAVRGRAPSSPDESGREEEATPPRPAPLAARGGGGGGGGRHGPRAHASSYSPPIPVAAVPSPAPGGPVQSDPPSPAAAQHEASSPPTHGGYTDSSYDASSSSETAGSPARRRRPARGAAPYPPAAHEDVPPEDELLEAEAAL